MFSTVCFPLICSWNEWELPNLLPHQERWETTAYPYHDWSKTLQHADFHHSPVCYNTESQLLLFRSQLIYAFSLIEVSSLICINYMLVYENQIRINRKMKENTSSINFIKILEKYHNIQKIKRTWEVHIFGVIWTYYLFSKYLNQKS